MSCFFKRGPDYLIRAFSAFSLEFDFFGDVAPRLNDERQRRRFKASLGQGPKVCGTDVLAQKARFIFQGRVCGFR